MAIYWVGQADAVAQVTTVTVGGTLSGETFTISVGGVAIASHTDATTTIADTVAALVSAWNLSTHPYATGITAADTSPSLTLTADTAGVPFVITLNTPGGSATFGQAATVASAGPNDWSTAANWSGGAVPVADDDVILRDSSVNICWGLDQSAVDLDTLIIEQTYTGRIGLRYAAFATSANGTTVDTSKPEYRSHYLDIEVAEQVRIGEHYGPGSPVGSDRIKLNLGVEPTTVVIHNTSRTTAETGKPCVRLLVNHATSVVYIRSAPGGVGIAVGEPAETSTVSLVNVSDEATANSTVHIGSGTTITTYVQDGGTGTLQAAAGVTTVTVGGGTCHIEGAFAITTLNVNGGVVYPNSSGTITTLNLNEGRVDTSLSNVARTITTLNDSVSGDTSYVIDPAVITLTNGVTLVA